VTGVSGKNDSSGGIRMKILKKQPPRPLRIFQDTRVATFLNRPNRFLVRCELNGRAVSAFLPNPGRLRELLLPGRPVHLVREEDHPTRKTRYTAVAVERDSHPVVLHTHKTNDVARRLIELDLVPGLKGARVNRAEVKVGRSRFDFLLSHRGADVLLEVKSCTLAGDKVAMFPDAVTERGARHVRELARIAEQGTRTAVLFVVQWPRAEIFMPDFHTDLGFTRAMLECRRHVQARAVSVRWDQRLSLLPEARPLEIPWRTIEREAGDRGSYLVLVHLNRTRIIPVGRLGSIRFPRGFYVYVGSAMANLSRRIQRHRRLRKGIHWHMDWLRPHARWVEALAIRSSDRLECELARAIQGIAAWSIPGFGCSDCHCKSHLFGMADDPLLREDFHDLLAWYRMDRLS
jgi:sugar fermentation stimulation protein A